MSYNKQNAPAAAGVIIIIIGLLYTASLYNYLLFHSLAEIFSTIVAACIFIVALNTRELMDNDFLLFLGIAYFFIGGIDLLHTLSYKGMSVIREHSANIPTQLWILARYLEGISLLLAPIFLKRKIKIIYIFGAYAVVSVILVPAIFHGKIFPTCYIEASGLTPFKKLSEYIISMFLISAAGHTVIHRKDMDPKVFVLIISSILVTVSSELFFTFYINVFGFSNLVGHFLKIVSFYLIYKAIVETGLKRPYSILFRNLKESETSLFLQKEKLEEALSHVKTLSGLLPICASCKKIRDDKGYWNQIESYIREHSEANFSHGICPDCARKYYPELYKEGDQPSVHRDSFK